MIEVFFFINASVVCVKSMSWMNCTSAGSVRNTCPRFGNEDVFHLSRRFGNNDDDDVCCLICVPGLLTVVMIVMCLMYLLGLVTVHCR